MGFEAIIAIIGSKPAHKLPIYHGEVLRKEDPIPAVSKAALAEDVAVLENINGAKGSLKELGRVCQGSDVFIGSKKIQNVAKVSELIKKPNEITGRKEDPRNLNCLRRIIQGRPYIIIENPFRNLYYLIKNDCRDGKNADELLIYEKRSKNFVILTQNILDNLQIPEQAGVALFNRDKDVAVAVDSLFYHEIQTQGQCGIHAANAYLGGRYVIPSKLSTFDKDYLGQELGPGFGVEEKNAELFNAAEGNNAGSLAAYIRQLALDKKVPERFQGTICESTGKMNADKLATIRQFEAIYDRCIIGNARHFIAFRKDPRNRWFCINSETFMEPQKTPSEYMKGSQGNFEIIHEGPKLF